MVFKIQKKFYFLTSAWRPNGEEGRYIETKRKGEV